MTLNADGSFSYTPAFHYLGSDSFTFQAQEGTQFSATAAASLNVTDNAPQGEPAFYGTPENMPLTAPAAQGVLASDYDADGDALSAALVSGPADGALTLCGDGSFVYTPNTNWYGTDRFTYQASDGLLNSDPVTVTIQVDQVFPDTETNAQPYAVALADFNGDGNLDAAVADKNQGTVSFLLGDGTVSVLLGNGDGTVSVLLGNGDGTFQAPAAYAVGSDPVTVAVGDFNGDGAPDLSVVNHGSNSVMDLYNAGDGTFGTADTVAADSVPTSVAVGDLNHDGLADQVAVLGDGEEEILGVSSGTLDPKFPFTSEFTKLGGSKVSYVLSNPEIPPAGQFNDGDVNVDKGPVGKVYVARLDSQASKPNQIGKQNYDEMAIAYLGTHSDDLESYNFCGWRRL